MPPEHFDALQQAGWGSAVTAEEAITTEETIARHSLTITEEIERLLDGQPLWHLVNPDYVHARDR